MHVLQGRITLDGNGVAGAVVELFPGDWPGSFGEVAFASGESGEDGSFSLRLFSSGRHVLVVRFAGGQIFQQVELAPGTTSASIEVEGAALLLRGAPYRSPADDSTRLVLRVHGPGEALMFAHIWCGADSQDSVRIEHLPAGDAELLRAPIRDVMLRGYLDDDIWTPVASIHLEVGLETILELS